MFNPIGQNKAEEAQEEKRTFSESKELNHERNPVATAQKQMATQETAGVLDYGRTNLTDSYERFMVENPLEQVKEQTIHMSEDQNSDT